jgi:hypothetical protein
MMAHHVPKAAD